MDIGTINIDDIMPDAALADGDEILSQFAAFCSEVKTFHLPRWKELPEVDLYMEQVVTVLSKYLWLFDKDDDMHPVITPSMINNYVKCSLIPAPVKKKYGRAQLAYLVIICMLKQVLSISDIGMLIDWTEEELPQRYDAFCDLQESAFRELDIEPVSDALTLSMMALTTKLYAQKLIQIQLKTVRSRAAQLGRGEAKPDERKRRDRGKTD